MLAFVAVFVSIPGEIDFVHLDGLVECDCCSLAYINLSGVDNDDFMAIRIKRVTCLLKCYDQCLGVCAKNLC